MERAAEPRASLATYDDLLAFYDELLPRVYAYFARRCPTASVAEDLTQETFLSAAKEVRQGSRIDAPERWIFALARHRLVDHYRSREREERKLALVREAEVVTDQAAHALSLSRERAREALEAVPAAQRLALTLRYLDAMNVPEVAGAIGRSVRATESLLARGRESFRNAYLEVQR